MTLEHLPEIFQRVQLYLPHTLARHTNFLANLFERRSPVTMQAEAALDNRTLPVIEFTDPMIDDVNYVVPLSTSRWFSRSSCAQSINRATTVFMPTVGAQRNTLVQRDKSFDICDISLEVVSQFLHRRSAIILFPQSTHCAQTGIDVLDNVNWQTDDTGLVHDPALDALSDPPGRIGRETKPALRIKFLHSVDQAEVSFLNKIQERQTAVDIAARNLDYQPEVALDHTLASGLIAAQSAPRVFSFLFRGQQRRDAYLVQIPLCRIQRYSHITLPFRQGTTDETNRLPRSQMLSRVNRLSVAPDLKMQSRLAFRPLPHGRDALAFFYFFAFFDQQRRRVPVGTQVGVVML